MSQSEKIQQNKRHSVGIKVEFNTVGRNWMNKAIKIFIYICGFCMVIGAGFLAEIGTGGLALLQEESTSLYKKSSGLGPPAKEKANR